MADISIGDVLSLMGHDLEDGSGSTDRFREFLLKDKWQPDHFETWLTECVTKGNQSERYWYNAMQDIAVALGKRLGFEVEFGRYSGSTSAIAYDGLWRSQSGAVVLVEVKASGWPVTSVGQLGQYVQRYAETTDEPVYGLYVIGSASYEHLIDQIKGGEYRNRLRLIAFEDLVKLWRLKADLDEVAGRDAASQRIQSILLPIESVDLGNLVRLLLEISELRTAEATEEIPDRVADSAVEEAREPWEREELLAFFGHNTDWQNAFLAVLALTEEEQVFADRLLGLMNRVANEHIPGLAGKSLRSVAGVRAGFKMRRGRKEDFVGARWTEGGEHAQNVYWLGPPYKEWIRQWVRAKGWDVPASPASTV